MSSGAKLVRIQLPRDVLESLQKGTQSMVPFQTNELGFPLRIEIYATERQKSPPKFGSSVLKEKKERDKDEEA